MEDDAKSVSLEPLALNRSCAKDMDAAAADGASFRACCCGDGDGDGVEVLRGATEMKDVAEAAGAAAPVGVVLFRWGGKSDELSRGACGLCGAAKDPLCGPGDSRSHAEKEEDELERECRPPL